MEPKKPEEAEKAKAKKLHAGVQALGYRRDHMEVNTMARLLNNFFCVVELLFMACYCCTWVTLFTPNQLFAGPAGENQAVRMVSPFCKWKCPATKKKCSVKCLFCTPVSYTLDMLCRSVFCTDVLHCRTFRICVIRIGSGDLTCVNTTQTFFLADVQSNF